MKKSLIALAAIYISVVAFSYRVHAQGSNNVIAFADTKDFARSIQLIPFFYDSSTGTAIDANTINTKAIKHFTSEFGANLNETWYKITDGFVSNFKAEGFNNRVYYDRKGRWQYTVKAYGEKKLPREIRAIVKSVYYDYAIIMVEEVQAVDNMIYVIHLDGEKDFMKVRISKDGDLDVMEAFVKG